MNLSDFMGGPNGASTINIGSDTTLSMGNGSTQILVPSGAYTVTPPTDLGDSGMLLLYNDSEYNLKIMIDDPDYFTLVAGKVCRLFYGNSKWYVVTSNTKEPFHDIDPNNLNHTTSVFYAGSSNLPKVVTLDSNHILVGSVDANDNNHMHFCVGTISGSTITFGANTTVATYARNYSIVALNSTYVALMYVSNNYELRWIMCSISGSTITISDPYGTLVTGSIYNGSITNLIALDSTHIVIAYRLSTTGYPSYTRVGVVSGMSITFGTATPYVANVNIPYSRHLALSSTRMLVVGDSYSYIGTLSGTTITYSSASSTPSYSSAYSGRLGLLDPDKVAFITRVNNYPYYYSVYIGTISGDSITWGPQQQVDTYDTNIPPWVGIIALDSTHILVAGSYSNGSIPKYRVGTISGNTVIFGTPYNLSIAGRVDMNGSKITNSEGVFVTADTNGSYGTTTLIY